jgi:hypothetical protein
MLLMLVFLVKRSPETPPFEKQGYLHKSVMPEIFCPLKEKRSKTFHRKLSGIPFYNLSYEVREASDWVPDNFS